MRFPLDPFRYYQTGILRFAARLDQRAQAVKYHPTLRPPSFLGLERPRQEPFDRGVDRALAAQDGRDGFRYRHLDVLRSCELDQHRCSGLAFRKLAGRRLFAAAERKTERKIARLWARAGQDQIAKAGQAGERLTARAER